MLKSNKGEEEQHKNSLIIALKQKTDKEPIMPRNIKGKTIAG